MSVCVSVCVVGHSGGSSGSGSLLHSGVQSGGFKHSDSPVLQWPADIWCESGQQAANQEHFPSTWNSPQKPCTLLEDGKIPPHNHPHFKYFWTASSFNFYINFILEHIYRSFLESINKTYTRHFNWINYLLKWMLLQQPSETKEICWQM